MESVNDVSSVAQPAPGEGVPLRQRAMKGSAWSIGGFAVQQFVRLLSNLILTRLLFPEVFGLMALVQVVMGAIQMFSDAGINLSVIQHKRGEDDHFINTAWTLTIVRGVLLWMVTCLAAWPAAVVYDQPQLLWLIPIVGFQSVINGVESTAVLRLSRKVNLRPLVIRDIGSQLVSLVVMIVWALYWPSVWVLVGGRLIQAFGKTALSYAMLPGPTPRLCWDREAIREIFRFGRWIFLATALTFLIQRGDVAVLGTMIDQAQLGIYAIAVMWSRMPLSALLNLNARVLFPIYAHLSNYRPKDLRSRLRRARLVLMAVFLPIGWVMILGGEWIAGFLYDPRYAEMGWMLQILAVGTCGAVIGQTAGGVLLSTGDSFRHMVLQIFRASLLIAGMSVGAYGWGMQGMVCGIAASKILDYPVMAFMVNRYNCWLPALDLAAYGATAVIVILQWWVL